MENTELQSAGYSKGATIKGMTKVYNIITNLFVYFDFLTTERKSERRMWSSRSLSNKRDELWYFLIIPVL